MTGWVCFQFGNTEKVIWVFPKIGGNPPKWMVKIMENPIKIDDLEVPLFLETPIYLMFNHFERQILCWDMLVQYSSTVYTLYSFHLDDGNSSSHHFLQPKLQCSILAHRKLDVLEAWITVRKIPSWWRHLSGSDTSGVSMHYWDQIHFRNAKN